LPVPDAPAVTVIHVAALVALQAHPEAAVTVMVPVAPVAAAFVEAGEIVGAHGAPACVTVNVSAPIVIVPVRGAVEAFAATV
jgi:hypothetical protein